MMKMKNARKYSAIYTSKFEFDSNDIVDMMCSMISGISYWGELSCDNYIYDEYRRKTSERINSEFPCYEEVLVTILESDIEFLTVFDIEEEKRLKLDMNSLAKGFREWLNSCYSKEFIESGCDLCMFDAECGDQVVQFSLFGDVIYS